MSTIKTGTTLTTAYQVEGDTTGALVIQTGASPTTAVTIGSDQSTTLAGTLNLASQNMTPYTGFKNRIINGAMMIDQRNAGASVTITNTAASTYVLDRWAGYGSQASKFSVQQNAGSVTPPTGFKNYIGATSLSAYTVGSSENFTLSQNIEGFNVADLGWGAAGASSVTLSFWVRSSLTGTFGGSLINSAVDRSYVFSFSISAANTWEQKTITIAGDTSGTWVTNNGIGIRVSFGLGVGSTLSTSAGSWGAGFYISATGATSVVGTNGATFYITGVQLEKGSTATSFDYRPYSTEFQLCQRYCRVVRAGDSYSYFGPLAIFETSTHLQMPYPVNGMRTPAMSWTVSGNFQGEEFGGTLGVVGIGVRGTDWVRLNWSGSATAGQVTAVRSYNDASAKMTLDCEL